MKLPGFAFLERRVAGALRAWIIAGILLRVTRLRDSWDWLALVFYTTPWPVVAAGFCILAVRARLLNQAHALRRYVLFTGGALFTWVATSWYAAPPPPAAAPAVRVVHWNVARPDVLLPRAAAWLRAQDADILCIAEAQPRVKRTLDRWRTEFPDYRLQPAAGEMICLVRGEVLLSGTGSLVPGSIYAMHRLQIRGRRVNVMQVDIDARPGNSRRAAIEKLVQFAQRETDGNLIIAGDFNLPRESAFLDPLRRDFRQCFEAAGRGLAETWPAPLLALSLDQAWAGRAWQPVGCRHGWSWISDHRPVVAEFAAR